MRQLSLTAVLLACAALGCTSVSPEDRNLLLSANTAYQHGDNAAAIAQSSRFIQAHGRTQEAGEAHYIRGLAEFKNGQAGPAREDFQAGLKLTKRKDLLALLHNELVRLDYEAGQMRPAQEHFRQVLDNVPRTSAPADQAMYRLGCVLQHLGQWRQADQYFDRVMQLFEHTELASLAANRVRATHWSIQAGAYASEATGRQLEAQLKRDGLAAHFDLDAREGKLMRLLRVGNYPTYDAAQADLPRVQKHESDAFITSAR